jgi:hypothetical protein
VDAATHETTTFLDRLESSRQQYAYGCEYDRGIERFGWRVLGRSRPFGTERARKILRGSIAPAGESKHASALPFRDLDEDMRCRPEGIDAERPDLTNPPVAAPTGAEP